MEKIEKEIIQEERRYHKFYCDKCGKHLGTYGEYEDGWYDSPEHVKLKIFLFDKWVYLDKGMYCTKCEKIVKQKLINTFECMGFKGE